MRKHFKSVAKRLVARRRINIFSWRWKEAFLAVGMGIFIAPSAFAVNINFVGFSANPVTYEDGGLPYNTTIQFSIDAPGRVQVDVTKVDTNAQVTSFTKDFNVAGSTAIVWSALWNIDGEPARQSGKYQCTLTLSTGSSTSSVLPATLLELNSVDIHSISITGPVDPASHNLMFPYSISYALAKDSKVTIKIYDSTGTVVRTLLNNVPQSSEVTSSHTVTWDGLDTGGTPVPLGEYLVTFDANDLSNGGIAYQRSRTVGVLTLATGNLNAQQLFDQAIFVKPNPIRDGQGTFVYQAIRDGAAISLRIYTLTGTLVFDKDFGSVTKDIPQAFVWDAVNQSGNKLGRGLYFYVFRETDPQGTLQVTKKLAVIK